MTIQFGQLPWTGIAVSTVGTFFLGAVWYTVFSRPWIRFHGYTPEQIERMKALRPPIIFFGGMIVSYALMAIVLAILVGALATPSFASGALLGILIWLGVAVPIGVTGWIASDKHFGAFAIDLGYQMVFLVGSCAILAAWQ
jgi:hypothetical protein